LRRELNRLVRNEFGSGFWNEVVMGWASHLLRRTTSWFAEEKLLTALPFPVGDAILERRTDSCRLPVVVVVVVPVAVVVVVVVPFVVFVAVPVVFVVPVVVFVVVPVVVFVVVPVVVVFVAVVDQVVVSVVVVLVLAVFLVLVAVVQMSRVDAVAFLVLRLLMLPPLGSAVVLLMLPPLGSAVVAAWACTCPFCCLEVGCWTIRRRTSGSRWKGCSPHQTPWTLAGGCDGRCIGRRICWTCHWVWHRDVTWTCHWAWHRDSRIRCCCSRCCGDCSGRRGRSAPQEIRCCSTHFRIVWRNT